ncbi:MAG TPA: CapA family protein [Smithellaceae bacterium]|nr:CapA family protein [Smithellaceae bacterium]
MKGPALIISIICFILLNIINTSAADSEIVPIKEKAILDPKRPLAAELKTSVAPGFTLVATGDLISSRPLYQLTQADTNLAQLATILQKADVTFGNLETTIIDLVKCKDASPHAFYDWPHTADPQVARDLVDFGFKMVSRANNHSNDWGIAGMRETTKNIEGAALIHAGCGENRAQARAAKYLNTAKGRVALVSMTSTFHEGAAAMPPHGYAPSRPGINALRLKTYTCVNREMMDQLWKMKNVFDKLETPSSFSDRNSDISDGKKCRQFSVFDTDFQLSSTGKEGYHYELNALDLKEILTSIRLGKQHSDFLIASLHSHDTAVSPHEIPDYLTPLARKAIDSGADIFLVHGNHVLGPIEIYKNRVIAYGLGNFFWSDIQEPLPAELYESNDDILKNTFVRPEEVTDAEFSSALNASTFSDNSYFQSIILLSRYEGNLLKEVRIYPVDLGYGRILSKSGIPHLASPDVGRLILERIQLMSKSFGTRIKIKDDGTGVIDLR